MKNILFYKYVNLDDLEELKQRYLELGNKLRLKGTILLAKEGINCNLTGTATDIAAFKKEVAQDRRFSDVQFKEGDTETHNFKKLKIKVRKEIVVSRLPVKIENAATYLEPHRLKQWFDSNEDFIMVDMRNTYESDIGQFENTVPLRIDTFRQLPSSIEQIQHLKNKKIVAYCTGGVRCEKGSAYLKQQGFTDVYQLHGGILQYGVQVGSEHWKGKCLVFDTRGAIDIDPRNQSEPITQCVMCHLPYGHYHNCAIPSCDKRFIACPKCLDVLESCCSKNCRGKINN